MGVRLISILLSVAIAAAGHAERVCRSVKNVTLPGDECSVSVPPGATTFSAEVCFSLDIPGNAYSDFRRSVRFNIDGTSFSLVVEECVTSPGTLYEQRRLSVTCYADDNILFVNDFDKGVNLYGGYNYLLVDNDGEGCCAVYIGDDTLTRCGSFSAGNVTGITASSSDAVGIDFLAAEATYPYPVTARVDVDAAVAKARAGDYNPVGLWTYLDRDNDPDYARPGGEYRLAVIPADEPGRYLVVYISGARTNKSRWKPGMVKGVMTATPYRGMYRLQWWDAAMERVDSECQAVVDDATLTFRFPILRSSLRFGR